MMIRHANILMMPIKWRNFLVQHSINHKRRTPNAKASFPSIPLTSFGLTYFEVRKPYAKLNATELTFLMRKQKGKSMNLQSELY